MGFIQTSPSPRGLDELKGALLRKRLRPVGVGRRLLSASAVADGPVRRMVPPTKVPVTFPRVSPPLVSSKANVSSIGSGSGTPSRHIGGRLGLGYPRVSKSILASSTYTAYSSDNALGSDIATHP